MGVVSTNVKKEICLERWEIDSGLGSLEARARLHTHLEVSSVLKHNRKE